MDARTVDAEPEFPAYRQHPERWSYLVRRWKRDLLTPEEKWEFHQLANHDIPSRFEMFRLDGRRVRAERRIQQSWWLRLRRTEAEDRLEALGLSREVWRQLWLREFHFWDQPEPLDYICPVLTGHEPVETWAQDRDGSMHLLGRVEKVEGTLSEWLKLQEDDDLAHQAFWWAAMAHVIHAAQVRRSPEERFTLGRLAEACRSHLLFPERGKDVLKAKLAEWGMRRHQLGNQDPAAVSGRRAAHDYIRLHAAKLKAKGMSNASIARTIAAAPAFVKLFEGWASPYKAHYVRKLLSRGLLQSTAQQI